MLSPVQLHTTKDLIANPELTAQVIALANEAFNRSKAPWPDRWNFTGRFPTHQLLYDTLGPLGTLAVIVDYEDITKGEERVEDETFTGPKGRPVACAALIPWSGGWAKEGAATEKGWEIKCVCVDGAAKHAKTGLAVRLLDALERLAIEKERANLQNVDNLHSDSGSHPSSRTVRLWILVAECINGKYWPKRGYREIRRKAEGVGTWGSKTGFEMVVMARDIVWEDTVPKVD